MTKKYYTPMLQIVSISRKDIIATSLRIGNDLTIDDATNGIIQAGAADRFHELDSGY